MKLTVRRTNVGDLLVLAIDGDVDLSSLPTFSDAVMRVVDDTRGKSAAVDLDGVRSLDDSALGVLLGAAGRARSYGGEIVVISTNEKLRARLAVTQFDQAVQVRSTIVDI